MSDVTPTAQEIERDYNPRTAVPDHQQWFDRFADLSRQTRERHRSIADLRYGPNPKELLDLFVPQSGSRGTLVFIHGGYWRAMDKADHLFVADPFLAQGYSVAVINYDLCPDVTIATIVDECRRAIAWLASEGERHGACTTPMVVGGHSAGGHLAAMMLATPAQAYGLTQHPVSAAFSLSGLHDLRPLIRFSLNEQFGLDDAQAARLSPALYPPAARAPVLVAVGGDETAAFRRQTELLWEAWPANRMSGDTGPLVVPGRHHFSVAVDLADPESLLTRAALRLFIEPVGAAASR